MSLEHKKETYGRLDPGGEQASLIGPEGTISHCGSEALRDSLKEKELIKILQNLL
jgi:hypothetical protein